MIPHTAPIAAVLTQNLQTPQMGPSGDVTILTNTKLPPLHQVQDTKEEENPNQKNLGHLNDSTTTSLPNREGENQHPDPHSLLVEVSNK